MKRILFCILALWGFVCSIESKGENEESDLSIILKSLLIDTKKHYEKCDWDCVNIMDDNTMTGSYDILTAGDLLVSIVKTVSNDTIYGNLIVYEGNKFQLIKKHPLAACMRTGGKIYTGGVKTMRLINREIVRACRENGIYTNVPMVVTRYAGKVWEKVRKGRRDLKERGA